MKNIIPLFVIVILWSCSGSSYNFHRNSSFVDLQRYHSQGFFITTGDLHKAYEPIGIIEEVCYHGMLKTKSIQSPDDQADDIYYNTSRSKRQLYICKYEEMLQELVKNAKQKGANGIINLTYKQVTLASGKGKEIQKGILISGMAIKH